VISPWGGRCKSYPPHFSAKPVIVVGATLTHLSPLDESVVPAADFYKVKDKWQFLHGGSPELVRIQRRVSRKRYLNSKRVYEYERVSLHIPRKYHELVKPFLEQDFDVSVAAEKDIIIITLTPQKTVKHAESPSWKPP